MVRYTVVGADGVEVVCEGPALPRVDEKISGLGAAFASEPVVLAVEHIVAVGGGFAAIPAQVSIKVYVDAVPV